MARTTQALALATALALAGTAAAAAGDEATADSAGNNGDSGAELRLHRDGRGANAAGPLAAASALHPGLASATPSAWVAEAELRHTLRTRLGGTGLALAGNGLLAHEWSDGTAAAGAGQRDRSRVNELHGAADLGAWQLGAGKKVLGWDVGYGFRPIDVVQQEERRQLYAGTPEGRPLLQAEHFGAEDALTLVWVNPQRWDDAAEQQRGARESAFAGRWYRRFGALDVHALGRWGRHTGWSAGGALAWVATDELELHASWRALHRHDGWQIDPAAGHAPVAANPWAQATLGGTSQWLLGGQWTGALQQSLMVEAWHDGTAPTDRQWDAWAGRNAALLALGRTQPSLATAAAGNLAWQATPFSGASLRQDNLYLRLAWQPEHWQWTLDALLHPADRGRMVTAAVQWQGDRLRLNAAWRVYGGPANALLAQLPQRRALLLAAAWAF